MGGLKKRRFLCATLLFASAAAFADRPPQHAELRMAINLGKYDQAREYIKQGVKDIYCGDMPADSAKAVWAKRWKQNPELALTGCLPQYTHFYPEKACEIRGVSPNICPGRLKDSATLADPKRFAALAKAALSNPEHKTRLRDEIATLGEERLIALADEAGFDFVRDSVLPEKMAAWAGMLRDLQRKFKLFGDGEKDYYPGSEKWMKSERTRKPITSYKKRKAAADAGQSERILQKAPSRGDTESQTVHMLKIVEVVDYTPTGRRVVVYSDGAPTTPQFTGKEMDAETGLYHFGARQYDPELGLWAQVDPGRQFASPYAYAGNGVNPINSVDPDGMKPGDVFKTYRAAAYDWSVYTYEDSKRFDREFGSVIFKVEGGYAASPVSRIGEFSSVDLKRMFSLPAPDNAISVKALVHTHGSETPFYKNEFFSQEDMDAANGIGLDLYLMTPSGTFKNYDPRTKIEKTIFTEEDRAVGTAYLEEQKVQ